jgi:hypothetical protein
MHQENNTQTTVWRRPAFLFKQNRTPNRRLP